jgi:hypothetical protein
MEPTHPSGVNPLVGRQGTLLNSVEVKIIIEGFLNNNYNNKYIKYPYFQRVLPSILK